MGIEIERKYLVEPELLPELTGGKLVKQGYIATESFNSVRARIKGGQGYLTIKGPSSEDGLSRSEYEYEIPLADAHHIINEICDGGIVEKTRYELQVGFFLWEVDVFSGTNEGLVMAEVELPDVSAVPELPAWACRELTGDVRYYNMNLARHPRPERTD